jgi:hypothetical protein
VKEAAAADVLEAFFALRLPAPHLYLALTTIDLKTLLP